MMAMMPLGLEGDPIVLATGPANGETPEPSLCEHAIKLFLRHKAPFL